MYNKWCVSGFVLSILFWFFVDFVILPLTAMFVSFIGLLSFETGQKGRWMGAVGLVWGLLTALAGMYRLGLLG